MTIQTSLGVCRKYIGFGPPWLMKPGTPRGMQLEPAVNATLPASTSSFSFFMCSLTQDLRFGLVRSAIRYVGCFPTPFGTNGWAGSWVTGPGSTPGINSKNGPPPLSPTQPALFDEKSGGEALSWAAAGAADAPAAIPTRMLPARTFALKMKENILRLLQQCCSVGIAGARHALFYTLCGVTKKGQLKGWRRRAVKVWGRCPRQCLERRLN